MKVEWRSLLLLVCALLAMPAQAATAPRPNVLLVVLDDAGYSDLAGFGRSDAPTPNIESLAREGVRFTRHYADSTCRPARLALMTGREAARVAQNPDFRGIPPALTTLPEALREAGYRTHHVGKWHLGDAVRDSWPDRHGFDSWFGFLNQFQLKGPDAAGRFTRRPTYTDPYLQGDDRPLSQYKGHLEDLLTDRVIQLVKSAGRKPAQPWFINWWLFAPHHPTVASPEWLARFPDTPAGRYQALLAQADHNIGRVLDTLQKLGQADNTLVIVTSDNGGTNLALDNNAPYAGAKAGFQEGSLRTPLLVRWPDRRHAGEQRDAVVAIQDLYPTVLTSVGLPVPAGLDGQSLLPLLAGQPLAPRQLVHEIAAPGHFNFSLLSEDGRWRLTHDALYDLQADPTGASNVLAERGAVQQGLAAAFRDWRNSKMQVPVTATPRAGGWELSGQDFLRAPGYGAYTFAVGVSGSWTSQAAILSQQGVWEVMLLPGRRLRVNVAGQSWTSAPVALPIGKAGRCVPLVITSYFSRSRLHEGRNIGRVKLYVDGVSVLEQAMENPPELDADLSEPTRIGGISGELKAGRPLVFNAELAAGVGPDWPERSVEQAGREACAAAVQAR